ncbi:hypothetical protein [Streptomyces yaizuensis]|uniref:Ribbon-helix-helix protein CopG domain-containing protein n=1 Tax=Streptomyces yaizuensis TaxID=2989713 RepID=A0ABQ5P6G2_9ACTN|nr:hypothetical protein [Streptomyces sp. YSPA8]GLF98175.1 hypothetical protein SYYSPA8_27780 [Streptomyces sp. YSPA8]
MPENPLTLRLDTRALALIDASGNRTRALRAALEQIARGAIPDHRRPVRQQISARLPHDLVHRARDRAAAHGIDLAEAVEAVTLGTTPRDGPQINARTVHFPGIPLGGREPETIDRPNDDIGHSCSGARIGSPACSCTSDGHSLA